MKNLFVTLILCFSLIHLGAEEIKTGSKITDVTVYRSQAKETRVLEVNIPKGYSDVVLSGITMQMVDNSLQVSIKGTSTTLGAGSPTLLTAGARVNHFTEEPVNSKLERLRDSVKTMETDLSWIAEEKSVLQGEIALINANLKLGSTAESMKPKELTELADFYRSRIMELKKKLFALVQNESRISDRKTKFVNQLDELGSRKKAPEKEIVLGFSSESGGTLQLRCSYLVASAGWTPLYDIKVLSTAQPVNLEYKAKLFQQTGVDWKDVKMTVSTANPNANNNRPMLAPKYVDYVTYSYDKSTYKDAGLTNMMQMETKIISTIVDVPEVIVNEGEIMVEFQIDARQNIPSDGKEHICRLQSYKVPAVYKYHAVPKLDPNAFLLAKITDYGQYNLLAGNANIFFEDTYVGTTQINPQIAADTMLLSLGRDEKIVVRRTRIACKTAKNPLNGTQKETHTWETVIRNNKGIPIDIEILDQVPLTRRQEIVVELLESSSAEYTKEYGKLLWNFTIKPNDSKKIRLSYSVKYPNGKQVSEQ